MDFRSVLATKRDGGELSAGQIRDFMAGVVSGSLADHEVTAMLTAIFIRGMAEEELARWTEAMLHSGGTLRFPEIDAPKADKHSTGGVGDKVSIALAPAVAACGLAVPMISGRGLGHTGGTLDKLESIPGLRTDLSQDELRRVLGATGVAFGAQTAELVPADRRLYALRDVTGLIESIPLIASSIMSKKLAEGLDALVLDVKFGSGAFLREPERGAELARTMLALAERFDVAASAFQTSMDQPLGRAVGHALEIGECLDCLRGGGPADLAELVALLGGEMLHLAGRAATRAEGSQQIGAALSDGSALGVFAAVVAAQGGDPRCVEERELLPCAPETERLEAAREGTLDFADTRAVGLAVLALGGGRRRLADEIDPAVGIVWRRKAGEVVARGEELGEIHHRGGRGLEEAREWLARAIEIGERRELRPLVLARVDP